MNEYVQNWRIQDVIRKKWEEAQSWELHFWQCHPRPDTAYENGVLHQMVRRFGLDGMPFRHAMCLDIGPGPTGILRGVPARKWMAIEPLAEEYRNLSWCRFNHYEKIYAVAGEMMVAELVGAIDAAFCINVLDHVFDPQRLLSNVATYLRPSGFLLLSFDVHESDIPGHPIGFLCSEREARTFIERQWLEPYFRIKRHESGRCYMRRDGIWSPSWGTGIGHHWWLRRK